MRQLIWLLLITTLMSCNTENNRTTDKENTWVETITIPTTPSIEMDDAKKEQSFTLREYYFLFTESELLYGLTDSLKALVWNSGQVTPRHAHFDYNGEMGNGTIDMLLLKQVDTLPILCFIEQIERFNQITFWFHNKEENQLEQTDDILPRLDPNMFVELDIDLPRDIAPMNFLAVDSTTLRAELYTWMNPAFEQVNVRYDLLLNWNGRHFDIKRDTLLQ